MSVPKRWILKKQGDPELIKSLMEQLNVDTNIANLLAQRNITTFEEAKLFFRPSLNELHDPFLMMDMDKAVDRIVKAIGNNESIMLYGDYDVDGTTAVATLYEFLKRYPLDIGFYIPDRYSEGYGVSVQGIDYAAEHGYKLMIAVDCGIKAVEKIAYAKSKNIEFIICDHHRPGDSLPEAVAVLDPKRDDCQYPFNELSGCGVAFKLAQGIAQRMKVPFRELEPLLDLVALSIAADIVPVTGENRILTYFGLKRINSSPRPGIEAILKTAGVKRRPDCYIKADYCFTKQLTVSDLVFTVGPRVNAAGRIQSGRNSVELLISQDVGVAESIATTINDFNTERKNLDAQATTEAIEMIMGDNMLRSNKSTVLFNPSWHKGILGIVASRLTEHYYRPTIVFTLSNGLVTGSARSIREFDIYEAIDYCSDLLEHWGGHTFAAGLSLKAENLPQFTERFESFVSAHITEEMKTPVIEVDAFLDFRDINQKFMKVLKQFAPFGPGNMAPSFQTNRVYDTGYSKVVGNNHIKLFLTQPHFKGLGLPGIAFQMSQYFNDLEAEKAFDICYHVEENEWNGNVNIQLNIKDMQLSAES